MPLTAQVRAALDNLIDILDEQGTDTVVAPADPFTLTDELIGQLLDAEIDHATTEEEAASQQRSVHHDDEAGLFVHGKAKAWQETKQRLIALRFRLLNPYFARQLLHHETILRGGGE